MIDLTLGKQLRINKAQLPSHLITKIIEDLTHKNPKWVFNEKKGYSNWNTKEFLKCYIETPQYLITPKPYMDILKNYLSREDLSYKVNDNRIEYEPLNFTFIGELRHYQKRALKEILSHDIGLLKAPCSSGKSTLGLAVITKRQQPSLILVHTKDLLNQWIKMACHFLGLVPEEIGILGSGKWKIKDLSIGMIQTLARRNLNKISNKFGLIIFDECHRAPAETFAQVIIGFNAKYQLGLTATPYRKDKLDFLIKLYAGPIISTITDEDLVDENVKIKPIIKEVITESHYDYLANRENFNLLLEHLSTDTNRNSLIIADICKETREGHSCLVFTDRVAHGKFLSSLLNLHGYNSIYLDSSEKSKERAKIIEKVREKKIDILVCTGQLAGEGMDIPILSRLFLTLPINNKGRIVQYIGRIQRVHPKKKDAIVYDYIDNKIGICNGMAKARRKIYDEIEK